MPACPVCHTRLPHVTASALPRGHFSRCGRKLVRRSGAATPFSGYRGEERSEVVEIRYYSAPRAERATCLFQRSARNSGRPTMTSGASPVDDLIGTYGHGRRAEALVIPLSSETRLQGSQVVDTRHDGTPAAYCAPRIPRCPLHDRRSPFMAFSASPQNLPAGTYGHVRGAHSRVSPLRCQVRAQRGEVIHALLWLLPSAHGAPGTIACPTRYDSLPCMLATAAPGSLVVRTEGHRAHVSLIIPFSREGRVRVKNAYHLSTLPRDGCAHRAANSRTVGTEIFTQLVYHYLSGRRPSRHP